MLKRTLLGATVAASLALSAVAYAEIPTGPLASPFYVCGHAGFGRTDIENEVGNSARPGGMIAYNLRSKKLTGFYGRACAGYNLSSYFDLEFGAAGWSSPEYKGTATRVATSAIINKDFRNFIIDLLVRGNLNLMDNMGLFAKAGLAYVHSSADVRAFSQEIFSARSSQLRPKVAVGANFRITPNWGVDFTASRVFGSTSFPSSNYLPHLDGVTAGVNYNF